MSVVVAGLAALSLLASRPPSPRLPVTAPGRSRIREPAGDPAARTRLPVLAGLGAGAAVLLLAPGWSAAAAPVAALVVWDRVRRLEPRKLVRHRQEVRDQLPHVVDLLGALLRAGAAPDRALTSVVRVSPDALRAELSPFLGRLALGADPAEVWADLGAHESLGRLGVTLHRAYVTGASVAEAVHRLADDLRLARRAEVAVRVRQVEVKATAPLGACLLPAFVVVGIVPLVVSVMQSLSWS